VAGATAYVAEPSLADAITRHGPLPVTSVLALAAGLAEGLGAIHAAGIVHRDLKPSNVLLAEDGPRIIDFGISRAAEATMLTGTGLVVGSPGFMSPEQAQGRRVGPPSDVFSLGAVLTFAAIGEGPFGTGSSATLLYRVVSTPPDIAGLPAELRPLVEGCLAKDPEQRPSTDQLLAELNTAPPAAGWLPAPITQAFPSHPSSEPAPAASTAVDDPSARPVTEPATPSPPVPTDAPGGPPTITATSARTPHAAAGQPRPRDTSQPSHHGHRRRLAWALVIAGLLTVSIAAAVALATTMGAQPHQPAAGGARATSPAFATPTATAPGTQRAATTGISPSAQPPTDTSSPSSIPAAAPSGVFWSAAVLSSHYEQHAQEMVTRLNQSGFDGDYWWSTADNSTLPGYWVVTSGRFSNQADAAARAKLLQSSGFDGAYARCVGSRQACPSP
jgi:eukaryotic-like serine/threonine-protein kinase